MELIKVSDKNSKKDDIADFNLNYTQVQQDEERELEEEKDEGTGTCTGTNSTRGAVSRQRSGIESRQNYFIK